ncbi:ATP-binding protein [Kitasatospora sp. NPDC002965]|uniref:ATP-binding protein n=1 Tax=Kitasatospora sp. NPDC002965 TaxID=3154775 RepID=UPI0033A522C3
MRDVPPDPAAVPAARRHVADTARAWDLPLSDDALADVELCAGELIANAVEHAGGRCTLTVRWSSALLRIEVADTCPTLRRPAPAPEPDQDATDGRGLLLVEALAAAWGWEPAGTGKVVWFTYAPDLPLPGPAPAPAPRALAAQPA